MIRWPEKMLQKIKSYEAITDNIQKEITVFLCYVMEKSLSRPQSLETQALIRIADEFESVGDYLSRIAVYRSRYKKDMVLKGQALKELLDYLDKLKFFDLTTTGIYESKAHDIDLCVERAIN